MRVYANMFRWICRPQALVCFAVLCLCVGALGKVERSSYGMSVLQQTSAPKVKSASAAALPGPGCTAVPCLSLTFDDGPNDLVTPQILDILARQHIKATFFVVGHHIAGREAIVQREYREGHEVGNHSWDHPDLSMLSPEEVGNQLRLTQQAVAAAGVPMPRLLRPPYGAVDTMVASHNHLTVVRWNIDPEDWKSKDPVKITEQLMAQVRPGGIILLHDMEQATVTALEPALVSLKQHYQFVTVSQLLNLSPGDQGQYFGR